MPLNIKDPETDRLARDLARLTGESITESIRVALEERLKQLSRRPQQGSDLADIIARGRARATLDNRPVEAILGYDDRGLPA